MSELMKPIDDSEAIRDAIQAFREEPLHDWAIVAIWGHSGGDVSVYGESHPLQLKGYLHSGIWALAHSGVEGHARAKMDIVTDVRSFPHGRMDVVRLAGSTIGRGTFDPGWRWSQSVAPIVGTDLCELPHIGYVISGRMMILPKDGEGYEISAGDAINITPDHDAWTVGDEPCRVLEILSADRYGKSVASVQD
jgi:hypothetical protein